MVLAIKFRDQRKGGKQRKSIWTKGLTAGSLIYDKKLFEFKSNIILFLIKQGFDKQKKKKSFHSTHAMQYKYGGWRGGHVLTMHRKSNLLKVALTDGEMT